MADNIFINGRSAFHKDSSGKGMACFPDVCLCPPPPPAGPIPTPLPNNTMASDVTDCASSVLADSNPIATSKSNISKSTGDEAGKPQGGNVVTHNTQGKAYFRSFSFDVQLEGESAVRHLDMATHNHMSDPPGTGPWVQAAKQAMGNGKPCGPNCVLSAWKPNTCPKYKNAKGKSIRKTPHHIIPKHMFKFPGSKRGPKRWKYSARKAPCICVTGRNQHLLQHGQAHFKMDGLEYSAAAASGGTNKWGFGQARDAGIEAVMSTLDGCDKACLKKALNDGHGNPEEDRPVRCDSAPSGAETKGQKALKAMKAIFAKLAKKAKSD
ncbi:MAG TPA: PAAR-like domain-containing protein [Polyangia bacterium]|nr:PAAR-like domain-containing protein [Polyangia bacterium]